VSRPGQGYVHFGCCEIKRLDTNILVYIFISLFLRYRSLKYAKHTPVYQLTFFLSLLASFILVIDSGQYYNNSSICCWQHSQVRC